MGWSLIFFSVLYFNELKDLKWFYILWIVILIPLIGIGFWEVLTGNHLLTSRYADQYGFYRWPLLPDFGNSTYEYKQALYFSKRLVLLPIHQDLTTEHLDVLARMLVSKLTDETSSSRSIHAQNIKWRVNDGKKMALFSSCR